MEKQGFVSLWIGNMCSQDLLNEYTELIYTDEGEWLPSSFLTDFNINIDDFDEDFIEKICHENNINTLKELICGCSYEDVVIGKFVNMIGNKLPKETNSAILLYNFSYDNKQKINNKEIGFRYMGTVQYDTDKLL